MAGVGLHFDNTDLQQAQIKLNGLLDRNAQSELLDTIGSITESQTRRRISEEKQSPDGAPWAEWTDDYAQTRHSGHSLLENEGELLDSIQHQSSGSEVITGSNLIYAAIQHYGGAEVGRPGLVARPYLGLSQNNRDELESVLENWMQGLMQ
ncbi:phage virion morphogenesis protein [Thiomicrorhabdus sp. Kp2]|uniref:phage virion morphogenesis protein n=1 Tax=Thiomicrorhabdus sp. Kp2 TaxID=1123518 RepID=UPI0003F52D89|nr:phage virion morphogenesis protein [Thiomicrorhabdus sp. Kp2]